MTTTVIIYEHASEPQKLFARYVVADGVETNGVGPDAHVWYRAAMKGANRAAIKQYTLSDRRWPFPLPIVWDDTGEAW